MLNRNDLAKQFEQVVQQEIKNHNDSILATNISLQEFRQELAKQSEKIERNQASSLSTQKLLAIRIENLEDGLKAVCEKLDRDFKFLWSVQEKYSLKVEKVSMDLENLETSLLAVNDELEQITDQMHIFEDLFVSLQKSMSFELNEYQRKLIKELKNLKEELLAAPSEFDALSKKLEEKINIHKVDNEGLIRELQVIKKDAFIKEKKIENIYTLIERLSKRMA